MSSRTKYLTCQVILKIFDMSSLAKELCLGEPTDSIPDVPEGTLDHLICNITSYSLIMLVICTRVTWRSRRMSSPQSFLIRQQSLVTYRRLLRLTRDFTISMPLMTNG